jgi:hypothetical protein
MKTTVGFLRANHLNKFPKKPVVEGVDNKGSLY